MTRVRDYEITRFGMGQPLCMALDAQTQSYRNNWHCGDALRPYAGPLRNSGADQKPCGVMATAIKLTIMLRTINRLIT